jgi:hypothetical protein
VPTVCIEKQIPEMKNAKSVTAPTPNPQVDTLSFDSQLSTLKSDFIALWQSTSGEFPRFEREYSHEEQRATEARLEGAIIDEKEIDLNSEDAMLQMQRMKSSVRSMVVRSLDPEHRDETDAMLKEFSEAGDEFVRQARMFDPDLSVEDIFQALRNLWIINSMQVGFGLPVRVTPSGLAYSLLYPYSDNFLDDPSITDVEKREFSGKFRHRLSGSGIPSPSGLESRISALVEMIETEFPRSVYPDVYESLLAIHSGQEKSLRLHAFLERWVQSDLLDISVEKGGTSVLADAYLAKGVVSADEAEFSFGYGVFLQLIDDLQDVEEDLRNGHQTLFTLAASRGSLDAIANRLHRFVGSVLTSCNPSALRRPGTLTELVRRSCRVLVLESVARCPGLYSEGYSLSVERYSPVRFAQIRRLHEKMKAKQKKVRKALTNKRILTVAAACV